MKSDTHSTIEQVKDFIRNPFAWPGGYRQLLVMTDGEVLCNKCAKSEFKLILASTRDNLNDGWNVAAISVHWEGEPITCAHCDAEIESEYGVPE